MRPGVPRRGGCHGVITTTAWPSRATSAVAVAVKRQGHDPVGLAVARGVVRCGVAAQNVDGVAQAPQQPGVVKVVGLLAVVRHDGVRVGNQQGAPRQPVLVPGLGLLGDEGAAGEEERGDEVVPVGLAGEVCDLEASQDEERVVPVNAAAGSRRSATTAPSVVSMVCRSGSQAAYRPGRGNGGWSAAGHRSHPPALRCRAARACPSVAQSRR